MGEYDFFDEMAGSLYEIPAVPDFWEKEDTFHREAARALACCINTCGSIRFDWMEADSGLSADELKEALEGMIFQEPEEYDLRQQEDEDWKLRPQYISGNIRAKLHTAVLMNRKYKGRFEANVQALRAVLPEEIPFEEIGISIGSSWVPERYYAQFAKEVFSLFEMPDVSYSANLGQWRVKASALAGKSIPNVYGYGTPRMPALDILEHTLNASTVKVYDQVVRTDRKSGKAQVLNKEETLRAQEKQEEQQRAFQEWILQSPERVRELEKIFYETYSCHVAGRYDGSFLTLPDINPAFRPYAYQKNAVARIILEKDVLLNHVVGSGKTYILIMGIHERKRMGLSEKNLVVVPNHVLEAFERAHRFLYPEDRILVIRPEEFTPDCREERLLKVRDEDFTAVYMAFSSFDMVQMSRKYQLDKKKREIRSLRAKAEMASERWEAERLEKKAENAKKELRSMEEELPPDTGLTFEELGITTLAVDEVHNFKNISLQTKADGVVGMHVTGSKRSNALLEKSRYVRRKGGSLLFSTGTPLTNSISDLFVLQTFLQPEELEMLHLSRFDEWIGSFATRKTSFEIDVDSQNYRIMTRFSSFHNLPELTSLFANVCDFYSGQEGRTDIPLCDGYIDTVIPKSPEQQAYLEQLAQRTEAIRQKLVKGVEDNLLKITHDGRAAALDIRLADKDAKPDETGTKVFACARNIWNCLQAHPGTAQLVFCDIGTPKKGFNVYDELKKQLVRLGMPEDRIAFAHDANTDAKRRKLFEAVNRAAVQVLIGSTAKMGTGVNVQERLIAIHHLDVPWKPSDMIQREGRLIRQGNTNERVYRYRYITTGTFDAYSWQIVENKQRFIGQFMKGTLAERDARDIDDVALSYAEIKALSVGDPLLKDRIETHNELERMKLRRRQREQELRRMQKLREENPAKQKRLRERREKLRKDSRHFAENRENLTRQEREAFGEELLEALRENRRQPKERCFDSLHGFDVLLPAGMTADQPQVILSGVTDNRYPVDMKDAKAAGCVQRMEYTLLHIEERVHAAEEEIRRAKEELLQADRELEKGNPYEEQTAELNEKLLTIDQELSRRAEEKEEQANLPACR